MSIKITFPDTDANGIPLERQRVFSGWDLVLVFVQGNINSSNIPSDYSKRVNRNILRAEFKEKHKDLIQCSREIDEKDGRGHLTASGRNLIALARASLAYSEKSANCDIFHSLVYR